MNNNSRIAWVTLSFIVPLIGVSLYLYHGKNRDSIVFGLVGIIGIFVYLSIGIAFI